VVRGPISQRISAPGTLAPLRESRIGAEISGRIERVFVAEGDRVAKDDPLFQIDPEPYELARRQAEAGVDLARAERRQIEADLARARALLQKNVASQQEVDRLATRLAVARAQERNAGEAVALAELQLRRTLVGAPYAGAIVKRLADEGTTAQAQPQTIVVVLQETTELEGRANIPEAHLRAVQVGDRALLHVGGFTEPIETTISSVGDAVDPDTRTYEVRMRVPNPDLRFKGGIFAHVEIEPRPKPDALLIPRAALRTEAGRSRVLTVREGLAVAVPVRIGIVSGDVVEILDGLDEGEHVIVGEAAQTVAPGMSVSVSEEGIAGR
jgi:membrane fusion protein (multidrug efflux system)